MQDKRESEPHHTGELDAATLDLRAIIDIPALQALLEDLYQIIQLPLAILDLKGTVLIAIGWVDICRRFHRAHPQTAANCTQSDLYLARHVRQGEFVAYRCKNMLWDLITPIYISGAHAGNISAGQFFYADESVDEERLFRYL